MADNLKILPSTATSAVYVATDEVGSVHYQIVKSIPFKQSNTALLSLSAAESNTSVDLSVSDCSKVQLFWNITANTGVWKMVIEGYTPDEQDTVDLTETAEQGDTGIIRQALDVSMFLKIKITFTRTSGALTSVLSYVKV